MDKETGKEVLVDGKKITAEASFRPEETEGNVEVSFTFDGTGLAGHELVVFEKLFLVKGEAELEAASHEDLHDEGQTVKIPEMPQGRMTPRTGDESHTEFWYAFAALSVIGAAVFIVLKARAGKKKREE